MLIFNQFNLPPAKETFSNIKVLEHLQDPAIWQIENRVICHVLAAIYNLTVDHQIRDLTLEATHMAMKMQAELSRRSVDKPV